jgi:hypothetical protein
MSVKKRIVSPFLGPSWNIQANNHHFIKMRSPNILCLVDYKTAVVFSDKLSASLLMFRQSKNKLDRLTPETPTVPISVQSQNDSEREI